MEIFGRIYENRFGFISTDLNEILLEENVRPVSLKNLLKKNVIIFATEETMRMMKEEFEKEIAQGKVEVYHGADNRIMQITFPTIMFKNFNYLCGYNSLEQLKKDFEWETNSEAEIMKLYIEFLRKEIGLRRNFITLGATSFIAEQTLYKGLGNLLFYINNNCLPKTEKERKAVYRYYKNELLEKSGKIYGILDCEPGYYENVMQLDLNNFYGFILCAEKFLSINPYQALTGTKEPQYDYLNINFRRNIISNYRKSKDKTKSRGIRQFYKKANNLPPGRSGNLEIYLARTRKQTKSYLGPQHYYPMISLGIDYLNEYSEVFKHFGAKIICRDTDSIKLVGLTKEQGEMIKDVIGNHVVQTLLEAGLSEEEASCGIGQFKIEDYSSKYYQFADKAYCFVNESGHIVIKFAGMTDKEKEEVISSSNSFEEVVEKLKNRQVKRNKPIEVNQKYDIALGGDKYDWTK